MKLILQQLPNVKFTGEIRTPYLSQEAAFSLVLVERDTGGLTYIDMWRDAVSSLVRRRTNINIPLPGYDPHNYGISVTLDIKASLKPKKLSYGDLIKNLERHDWFCKRRDAPECNYTDPGGSQFNYLGKDHGRYLARANLDEKTWSMPSELYIWERYNDYFHLDTADVQQLLSNIGIYKGKISGERDNYTREAIMAFQRAWELIQSGAPDMTLCRVLSFVTAELKIL